METAVSEASCKFCNSRNIIKYGRFKNSQRWWCKDCHRKFGDNRALPRMKTATNQICFAVGLYYEGVHLNDISKKFVKKHNIYISDSTIYKWVDKFSRKGSVETINCHPAVGETWIANETTVKICGKTFHLIDILDIDTKFILATMFSNEYDADDVNRLIESAKNRAGKLPGRLILSGIEVSSGTDQLFYRIEGLNTRIVLAGKEERTKIAEQISGSYFDRNRVISNLKKQKSIKKIIDGWLFDYNYHRSNEFLEGKTPAEKAKAEFANRN